MIMIKRLRITLLAIVMGMAAIPASIMAHGIDFSEYRDDDRPKKTGVLVIALAPRDVPTAEKQNAMDKRIKEVFPGFLVRWCFFNMGSEQADAFIRTGEGMSPKQMLDQMQEEGITHVAILPLAVIPSKTYIRLVWMVDTLRKMPTKFRRISLAKPFFGAPEEIRETCQTVLNLLPERDNANEAVVLFFEEQSRLGDYIYPGLQYYFWQLDASVFIGAAGSTPKSSDVIQSLKTIGLTNVYLVPFLPYLTPTMGSWKKSLEGSGFLVRQVQDPVIGQKEALDVMISRLKTAVGELNLPND